MKKILLTLMTVLFLALTLVFTPTANANDPDVIIHTVEHLETIENIAEAYFVTVDQIIDWNDLENDDVYEHQELVILQPNYYSRNELIHEAVTEVLLQFAEYPVYVFFRSLEPGDRRYSSLEGDKMVFGASVPKVVLALYAMEMVNQGEFRWDDTFKVTDEIYNHPESYAYGGSGFMQSEDFRNKEYTLYDLVERTIDNSDNMASNMLLHYIVYHDKAKFDQYTRELYGNDYRLWVTPKEMTDVMERIYTHEDSTVFEIMESTDYDNVKLDTVSGNTYQKIGQVVGNSNHSTAIVTGDYNYAVTIMSNAVSDEVISEIANAIYDATQR